MAHSSVVSPSEKRSAGRPADSQAVRPEADPARGKASESHTPDLAKIAMIRAIDHRLEACKAVVESRRLAAGRPDQTKWPVMAEHLAVQADRSLVLAILATAPDFGEGDVFGAQQDRWPGRGVQVGGKLYLAIPHPDRDDDDGGDGTDLMRLAILDADRILDLEPSGLATSWTTARPGDEVGPEPYVLDEDQSLVLHALADLGPVKAIERLSLTGPYGAIRDTVNRLGSDAVDELRRIIANGGKETRAISGADRVLGEADRMLGEAKASGSMSDAKEGKVLLDRASDAIRAARKLLTGAG